MPNISASSYDHFRTCPRMFFWKHVIHLEPAREEGARRFGVMFHAGLEEWWKAMDGGDVPWRDADAALDAALAGAAADAAKHPDSDPFELAKARALLMGYHAAHAGLEFESVHAGGGVEMWFNLPLLDPDGKEILGWRVTGRKDVVKRFADGRVKPVEHKSTSSKIHGGADYWLRLRVDTQASMYVDACARTGTHTDRVLYDVARKPNVDPLLATPEDKRKYTKGKGCTACGGRAGGKNGVQQGAGFVMKSEVADGKSRETRVACEACNGSGWKLGDDGKPEAPRLHADQRLVDETMRDYEKRVTDEIASDPNAYYRQADVTRTPDEIAEFRHDLVVTTGEIGALMTLAQQRANSMAEPAARRCFPRNTQSCTNHYGRNCDYLSICVGEADPWSSGLYQIRKRGK